MRFKRALVATVKTVTLAYLGLHFALTVLYTLPLNPLSLRHAPLLELTIGTFFAQNWRLFAPTPVGSTQTVLVNCLEAGRVDPEGKAMLPATGWFDLSGPVIAHYQQQRFSAYDRLARPALNAARSYLSGGLAASAWLDSCLKGEASSCEVYKTALAAAREQAGELLARYGSSFCREALPGRPVVKVAMRVRDVAARPWSKRQGGDRRESDLELGLYDFIPDVETAGLFRAEVR